MLASSIASRTPAVSIILPTYNRARFLPAALRSICAQTLADWELIIVDDGSTDDTARICAELTGTFDRPVTYVTQENRGAYGARNVGLDHARGRYIAFFDSDDEWLPHHLQDSALALEANPDVDWVFGAGRWIVHETSKVLVEHSFYRDGRRHPFFGLRTRRAGALRIIEDERAVAWMMRHDFLCGLQKSIFRRCVFDRRRFHDSFRNESEDQVFAVRVLKAGHRFGFLDNVHMVYHVHQGNSSLSATASPVAKQIEKLTTHVRGYEELGRQVALTRAEKRALRYRLSRDYFWSLGYAVYWQHGYAREALGMFRRGIRLDPWNVGFWKTFTLASARALLRRAPRRCPA